VRKKIFQIGAAIALAAPLTLGVPSGSAHAATSDAYSCSCVIYVHNTLAAHGVYIPWAPGPKGAGGANATAWSYVSYDDSATLLDHGWTAVSPEPDVGAGDTAPKPPGWLQMGDDNLTWRPMIAIWEPGAGPPGLHADPSAGHITIVANWWTSPYDQKLTPDRGLSVGPLGHNGTWNFRVLQDDWLDGCYGSPNNAPSVYQEYFTDAEISHLHFFVYTGIGTAE
jgi:hypothetical protein